MTGGDCDSFHMPVRTARSMVAAGFGKLRASALAGAASEPATILDCFDGSLCASGRLLLRTGGRLDLVAPGGAILTQPAPRAPAFVADLPAGAVAAALAGAAPLRRLLPVGAVDLCRETLSLRDAQGKTRVRLHLWTLTSESGGAAALAILSGLRGYDQSLKRLRRHVADLGGQPLAGCGLYARLFPSWSAYAAAPQVRIGRDEAACDAAGDIVRAYIPVARANEAGIVGDLDTEFLHDYRIALRKIRSVLSLFKGVYDPVLTADLETRFSALMEPTGRLRDLDVYLLEKPQYYAMLPARLHGGLDRLFEMFAADRKREHARLSRHLKGRAYGRAIAALAAAFDPPGRLAPGPDADLPAHDYACALIWKRYRKIRRIADDLGPDTPDTDIHQLRIQCKKLRYLMEFFAPVFAETEFRSLIKPLKRLQDCLGRFNDCAVQQASLAVMRDRLDPAASDRDAAAAHSIDALIPVLRARQAGERDGIAARLARFGDRKTRRRFRDLFHRAEAKT